MEEARDGADGVVLLSHGVWTRRFGSDTDIVGALVDLDGEPHTVVGVLPEGFDFPNPAIDFWTPLVIPPFVPPSMDGSAVPRTVVTLVLGARTTSSRRITGAGRYGSSHHPADERHKSHNAVGRESATR